MPTVRNQKTTSAARQPENADIPSRLGGARIHVAITAFLALFSIVGVALYGLPFFYDFMVQDFGWTRRKVTSGNAYSKLLVGPAFGFLAGWIVDRMGPRRLMLAGIMMAGTALVGLGSISTLGMFYFFYLFNALGYVCGGPLPNQVLLSRWYDKARGKAMGFAYLGIGIGGTIVPRLESPNPLGGKAGERPEYAPVGPVFRNPAFYLLALGSMCSIGAVGGTMQNLKLFLSLDQKLPQGQIANVLSLVLLGSIAGRLLMGWLADRYPKKYVMLLIYTIVASAVPLLFYASVPGLLYAFAIIFGIGLGGDYMIIPLMAAELFGIKVLGRLMGVILTADGVAEALSPMLVATIRDSSGSYAFGFSLLIILAIIGAVSVAMLPRRRIA